MSLIIQKWCGKAFSTRCRVACGRSDCCDTLAPVEGVQHKWCETVLPISGFFRIRSPALCTDAL